MNTFDLKFFENGFSLHADRILDQILLPIKVLPPSTAHRVDLDTVKDLTMLIDPGTTITCINSKLVSKLGLKKIDNFKSDLCSIRGKITWQIYECDIVLPTFHPDKFTFRSIRVAAAEWDKDQDGLGGLIGMDILRSGDYAISNYQGRTTFTFRKPSIGRIDFDPRV